MKVKKNQILYSRGREVISGCNWGDFPKHSFVYYTPHDDLYIPPLYVNFTGSDEWRELCYRKRINSTLFFMEFVYEGVMEFGDKEGLHRLEPGDMYLVQKGSTTTMRSIGDARKWALSVKGDLLDRCLESTGLSDINVLRALPQSTMLKEMQTLYDLCARKPDDWLLKSSALLYRVFLMLSKHKSPYSISPDMENLIIHIDKNLSSTLSLGALADYEGISISTLNRKFQKYLGMSPIEYILKKRMQLAVQLLQNTSLSIKEISARSGYRDQLYFSHEFKKRLGLSPREFRRP